MYVSDGRTRVGTGKQKDQGCPRQLFAKTWLCDCAYKGQHLHAWGLIGAGTSESRDWNPGAATGQTECLTTAIGEIQIVLRDARISPKWTLLVGRTWKGSKEGVVPCTWFHEHGGRAGEVWTATCSVCRYSLSLLSVFPHPEISHVLLALVKKMSRQVY